MVHDMRVVHTRGLRVPLIVLLIFDGTGDTEIFTSRQCKDNYILLSNNKIAALWLTIGTILRLRRSYALGGVRREIHLEIIVCKSGGDGHV